MGKGKTYKKLHKWPGLIIAFMLLYFSVTGILMNHRNVISGLDISRDILPSNYRYDNWNLSAVKGSQYIGPDSVLLFGNIGIWLTDSLYENYVSFNHGFPHGADNQKIFDVHKTTGGNIYAATLSGLYAYEKSNGIWKKIDVDVSINRFVGIESINDTLYAMNRSYVFKGLDKGIDTKLQKTELPAPTGYKNEVSVFETIWQIHSGEIFGLPGKLFTDILGLITIFISITGIIFFFFPKWIKQRRKKGKNFKRIAKTNKWSLKWHNKTGRWIFVFLSILFFTGTFLRPPLLIAIANLNIAPVPYSHLDQPNPWYDKLRDIRFDAKRNTFLIATSEGIYHTNLNLRNIQKFRVQPPVSVMGITVFEPYKKGAYLIGSFSGLFLWHPEHREILDYAKGNLYRSRSGGRPVGEYTVTGLIEKRNGNQYMIDYDKGTIPLWHKEQFPQMPNKISEKSNMSLWNLSLEIHTGRFFSFLFGDFYILLVPLSGLIAVMVVISGYLLYRKRFKVRH
ncbi:PepSY-associated TM helix domain-containing protein [Salinivirga cyanobacteriivorans]